MDAASGSSPRGRGTRLQPGGAWRSGRVIPAWAGNTGRHFASLEQRTGHPRVGGEHSNCKQLICRGFTACKRATEQYTRFSDATGDGVGLRSAASSPSRRSRTCAESQAVDSCLTGGPAMPRLAASVLSLLGRSDRLGRPPPGGGPASAAWEALACPEPIQGYASVWVEPGAPVPERSQAVAGRRLQAAEVPNHHCARVGASASTAPRLPTRAHASDWIARAAGAWVLLCLHTTDGTTAPARGVEAGGAIIASRPAHRAVLPRG